MKFKIFSIFAALAMVICFSFGASAQYMTKDLILIKAGYIPAYIVTFNEKDNITPKDAEMKGYAGQAEYNLNFDRIWLGFGLEYQYQTLKKNSDYNKKSHHQFIIPMASFKFNAVGGLYLGAGLAGKYLIATQEFDTYGSKFDKKIDLWANGILGYYVPVGEGVFLDFEGRFGWNLTNKQFSKGTSSSGNFETDPKYAYDIAFFVGVGFRALGSNY